MSTDALTAPTLRVMALHALAYCERLFYLEEVEEIRVADSQSGTIDLKLGQDRLVGICN